MTDNPTNESADSGLIIGRNPVSEALKSGRALDSLFVAKGERSGSIGGIIAACRERGIPVKEVDRRKLDLMCGGGVHQGVAATAAAREYAREDDIFEAARLKGEPPLIVVCDEIEDPHNLGAIIRTADAAGAHGVIVPKRRSAPLSFAVSKSSAGALEYVPVVRVTNLAAALDELKERGVWIFGADLGGEEWCECDFTGPAAVVVGSEGRGLGRLVREKCDFIASLPMNGSVNSLNASVAAALMLYEAVRQRRERK